MRRDKSTESITTLRTTRWTVPRDTDRLLAVFLYLNDIQEGGETNFAELQVSVYLRTVPGQAHRPHRGLQHH